LFSSLTQSLKSLTRKIRYKDDEKALKRILTELKKLLLKSDVHHKTTKEIIKEVEVKTKEAGIGQESFTKALRDTLTKILTAPGNQGFVFSPKGLTVILMTGLQGSGKTTTTAKLAYYLKLKKKKVLMVAADLQRLAAVEQLKQLGNQIEVDVFSLDNSNPVEVAKEAYKKAKSALYDVLLIDTAGRLAIDEKLMQELANIKNAIEVDEIFYVADTLTGHDATKTASIFKEKVGIDGVILTKFDGDTRGGVALSIAHQVGVPLRFIGVGEKIENLEVFIPDRIVNRLMDLGDIEGLAEKASVVIDEKKAKKITKKIKKGEFNFNDFLDQLEMMKKLGSMKSIISMIPGLSGLSSQIKDMDFDNSDEIKRIKALISSMTPKERENPSLLNLSRKRRIAKGSGLNEMQVNKILKQFKNASKMAKKLSKGGAKGMQQMLAQLQSGRGFPR